MPDESSTDLALREEHEVAHPLPPMNDAEVAAAYRTAQAFAQGGLFKDAKDAGKAFTKILAGRDLGLTPFESMSGLHVFDGKVETGADLHATKVRQREGYDYRVAWLKVVQPGQGDDPPTVEAVWADEEDMADLRETYGCAIMFTVDGEPQGVSRFTHADAVTAGLAQKDNHAKYPRNMFYARAMTNGVAWYVPEVMGGLRVYGVGELPRGGEDVTAGVVADEGADYVELPMAVEAVLARARSLGHMGIAGRAAAEWAVCRRDDEGRQVVDPDKAARWVQDRTRDLNRFAAGREDPTPDPPDAEVVEPAPEAVEQEDEPRPVVEPEDVATDEELRIARLADPEAFAEGGSREARVDALAAARTLLAHEAEKTDTPEGRAADAIAESFAVDEGEQQRIDV